MITITEIAREAKYQLSYYLTQCGFGFLNVEIDKVDAEYITLHVIDDTFAINIQVLVLVKQMLKSCNSVFGELALSILRTRENEIIRPENSILAKKEAMKTMAYLIDN